MRSYRPEELFDADGVLLVDGGEQPEPAAEEELVHRLELAQGERCEHGCDTRPRVMKVHEYQARELLADADVVLEIAAAVGRPSAQ